MFTAFHPISLPKMAAFCIRLPFLLLLLAAVSLAADSTPPSTVDCTSLVLNLSDCLKFVMAGSTAKTPEGKCCSGLKSVLKTDAQCICEAFRNSAQFGVTLNVSKAVELPAACRVSAPDVSSCGLSTSEAPALAPLALRPSTSVAAPLAVAIGVDEVSPTPAPAGGSSRYSSICSSVNLLAIVAVVSFFCTAL